MTSPLPGSPRAKHPYDAAAGQAHRLSPGTFRAHEFTLPASLPCRFAAQARNQLTKS